MLNFLSRPVAAAALTLLFIGSQGANAAVFSPTSAAGINNFPGAAVGDHFHWGPGNSGQVNYSFREVGRGVAEFDFSALTSAVATATLSFRIAAPDDIYSADYPDPSVVGDPRVGMFTGLVNVVGYSGNNAISVSDYQAGEPGTAIGTVAAGFSVSDVFTFDVTSLVNGELGASLGVRWVPGVSPEWTAAVFDAITITTTVRDSGVPEPGAIALLAIGALAAGLAATRRHRIATR